MLPTRARNRSDSLKSSRPKLRARTTDGRAVGGQSAAVVVSQPASSGSVTDAASDTAYPAAARQIASALTIHPLVDIRSHHDKISEQRNH